jgi:hypothetical protein
VTFAGLFLIGLGAAPALAFDRLPDQCEADLLLDLRLPPTVELSELAPALAATGLRAVILIRPEQAEGAGELVSSLQGQGHELGLWVPGVVHPSRPPSGPGLSWGELRRDRRRLRHVTGSPVRAAGSPRLDPVVEGSLEIFGFTTLLPSPDGLAQPPRAIQDLQRNGGSGVVLWPVQPLEADAQMGSEGALAALLDRSTALLEEGPHPVIRLSLPASVVLRHGSVLERWRRQVLEPCGAASLTREQAERSTRAWIRDQGRRAGERSTPEVPPEPPPLLDAEGIQRAAAQIIESVERDGSLPRSLDCGLTLAQAWAILAQASLEQSAPLPVLDVLPPQASPRSVLPAEGVVIPRALLLTSIEGLVPAEGQQVPSFARIGPEALTAAELLYVLALAALARDPIRALPTYSPAPYSPGLGWD